jgi:hypothetical protein
MLNRRQVPVLQILKKLCKSFSRFDILTQSNQTICLVRIKDEKSKNGKYFILTEWNAEVRLANQTRFLVKWSIK